MKITQEQVWAGTESSLHAALDAEARAADARVAGSLSSQPAADASRLVDIQNGVAVITISGSLNNNSEPWYNKYMGATGYPEIRDAMVQVATDPSVKQVVLNINSGGGAVSGVADTAKLIRLVNDTVKPVAAYSDGSMMSAAYWLGASAGRVYASESAMLGSIGVISTHMERSKMLADMGIGVTVVRSGKFKALANSVEPLSPEGKAQIQQVVDASNAVFVDHVAAMRGTTPAKVEANMGQGREFVGDAAVKAGLIDGITSFDTLMTGLSSAIDTRINPLDNPAKRGFHAEATGHLTGDLNMTKALTAQDIAAMATGAGVQAATEPVTAPVVPPVVEQAAVTAAPVASTAESAVSAEVAKLSATVQLLTEQVAGKDAALLQANVALAQANDALTAVKASVEPLAAIAAKSIANMQIALGGSALDATGLTAAQIVAEHQRVEGVFASKFKVGGVAAASATTETPVSTKITAMQAALFAANAPAAK